ncbi:hypothetical protein HYT57_03475 [Candidatus Woesearchaeota archaeon]|nr:hypothetical protein [Candidatus Woesearchaeota archaeon]
MSETRLRINSEEELADRFLELKLRLGTTLVTELEKNRDKYMGRGIMAGIPMGITLGSLSGYFFMHGEMLNGDPITDFGKLFFGGYLGLVVGANIGLALGMLYANHRTRNLRIRYPEQSQTIEDYMKVRKAITALSIR